MPRVTVKIPNSYESITHQVSNIVARDVMKITDIDEDKVNLHVLGEFGATEQTGTKLNDRREDVKFGGNSRIFVTVDDSLKNDSILNQYVRSNEQHPILYDHSLGIGMLPVYVDSELTLSFKYIASSKVEAIKWRDEFAIRRAEDRTALYHELFYYLPIQDGVLGLLYHLYTLREKVSGYGDTFFEYVKSIQKRELTTLGTQDNDILKSNLAIPERQVQVTGYFDFGDIPKESKVDGTTTWEIEWSYKVLYKRCTHYYLTYPISIHQSHISRDYFSSKKKYSLEELNKGNAGLVVKAMDILDGYFESFPEIAGGVRYPEYDDWIPDHLSQPSYTSPQFTWLLSLSNESTKIADLNNLPQIRFTLEVEKYMREVYRSLNRKGHSMIHITVYKDGRPMDDSNIVVDENLVVHATRPLDLRSAYRLRLSLVTRKFVLIPQAVELMKLHPVGVLQLFQSLNPKLDVEWAMNDLLAGKYLKTGYIDWFFGVIEKLKINEEQRTTNNSLPVFEREGGAVFLPGRGTGSDKNSDRTGSGTWGGSFGGIPGWDRYDKDDNLRPGDNGGQGGSSNGNSANQGRWSKEYKSGFKYVQMFAFVTKRQ